MKIKLSELKQYIKSQVKNILSEAGEKVYVKGEKALSAKKSGHKIMKGAKGGMYYIANNPTSNTTPSPKSSPNSYTYHPLMFDNDNHRQSMEKKFGIKIKHHSSSPTDAKDKTSGEFKLSGPKDNIAKYLKSSNVGLDHDDMLTNHKHLLPQVNGAVYGKGKGKIQAPVEFGNPEEKKKIENKFGIQFKNPKKLAFGVVHHDIHGDKKNIVKYLTSKHGMGLSPDEAEYNFPDLTK